jgi:hypothetical protein
MKWLDTGVAPDQISDAQVQNGVVTRTRPLCAYPMEAKYGPGPGNESTFDVNDAFYWHCAAGTP